MLRELVELGLSIAINAGNNTSSTSNIFTAGSNTSSFSSSAVTYHRGGGMIKSTTQKVVIKSQDVDISMKLKFRRQTK